MNLLKRLFIIALAVVSFTSCELNDLLNTPTKQQMQGTWVLKQATNEKGMDITQKISFPVTAFQLNNTNGMVGTMGPMFTYLVYGESKWTSIMGKLDQAFDYGHLRFDDGEFFVADGQVNSFTVEPKLLVTAAVGGGALIDILKVFGVNASFLEKTIYHKFKNVAVSFDGSDTMIWTFDSSTQAFYNYKNAEGDKLLWEGWPTTGFQKCTFVFTRKTLKLEDIVRASNRY